MPAMLRVEAVNLYKTILDTDDLSTRRGGSYMLLQAVRDIGSKFKGKLESISTGASVGLFQILEAGQTEDLVREVRALLATNPLYVHATFTVAAADGDFSRTHEELIAAGRWQQMTSLSLPTAWSPPAVVEETDRRWNGREAVCGVDEVRPATMTGWFGGNECKPISTSVWRRRNDRDQGGRSLRQSFYARELERQENLAFTNDLETLARLDHSLADADASIPRVLDGKIALFYADGNGFGKIQAGCKSPEALREWDGYLKAQRRGLLGGLVDVIAKDPRWKTPDGALRLETLLWGGDELMFVVPAWCGLELAQRFFDATSAMRYPNKDGGEPLKHAAGLVFAHRNAPIGRLQDLAVRLAETGKATPELKKTDTVSWVVLESFDHAGAEIDSYLARRYPLDRARPAWGQFQLTPEKLNALRERLPRLRQQLPRSQLIRAVHRLAAGHGSDDRLLRRSYEAIAAGDVDGLLGGDGGLWFSLTGRPFPDRPTNPINELAGFAVLLELWDYAVEDSSPTTIGQAGGFVAGVAP